MKIFSRVVTFLVLVINLFIAIWSLHTGVTFSAVIGFAIVSFIIFASWKMGVWKKDAFPWTKRKDYVE